MAIRRVWLILLFVPSLVGCGALSGLAGSSTAAGVDRGLDTLSAEENRGQVAEIMGDRQIRREVRESTADIVDAILSEAMTEERMQRIEASLMRVASAAGGDLFGSDFETMAANLVAQIRPVLREMGHPESRENLALVTRTVVATVSSVMAESLRDEVGPAAREVIREDVAVGVQEALDERLTDAFANTARAMAREAVIGAGEGFDQLDARPDVTVLDRVRGTLEQGEDMMQILVFALGVLLTLLIGGLVLGGIAMRRSRAKAEEKHDALLLVMSTLKDVEDQPWSAELCDALKKGLRDRAGSDVVRSVLRARPDLRLCPGVSEQLDEEERDSLAAADEERSGIHARPCAPEPATRDRASGTE